MIIEDLRSHRVWSCTISIMITVLCIFVFGACHKTPAAGTRGGRAAHDVGVPSMPGIAGSVTYDDGAPAAAACLVFTAVGSGAQAAIVVADTTGRFTATLSPGEYAVAATAQRGAAWVEKFAITRDGYTLKLASDCQRTLGVVASNTFYDTRVMFGRNSFNTGDTFATIARPDGTFSLCLPSGDYIASLAGDMLSTGIAVSIPSKERIVLQGHPTREVRSAPASTAAVTHRIDGLINDILRSNARLVGIGEATHGSAEFVTTRSTLVFELAKRAQLQLVLLENDAISSLALDRYVNGDNIDLKVAISELGFWITDTFEFIHFLEEIRSYNLRLQSPADRIHVRGIDVQNTKPSVSVILANAKLLALSSDEQEMLQLLAPDRGKAVKQLGAKQRADLDTVLARLSSPMGQTELDTQISVAARSLAIQVGFLDGDTRGLYMQRREAGMAQLAHFIVERTGVKRAVLWAHNDHVSRHIGGANSVGQRLAEAFPTSYYSIGFFFYEGSTRAWDAAGKIGVVSHTMGPAPAFTVERVIMAMTGFPTIAWLPLRDAPSALKEWFEVPRYVREVGALYNGEDRATVLINMQAAFDAIVVIKTIHDSSPTPTGVRRASR
jgi:erythromycin esterase